MKIRFTAKAYPDPELTLNKEYEIKAFSKRLDSYRIINDDGYQDWYYRDNFEQVKEETE